MHFPRDALDQEQEGMRGIHREELLQAPSLYRAIASYRQNRKKVLVFINAIQEKEKFMAQEEKKTLNGYGVALALYIAKISGMKLSDVMAMLNDNKG